MSKLVNKLKEISSLLNANMSSGLKMPSLMPKAPKMPSVAPKSGKSPVKVAEQIKDPHAKSFAMDQAVGQVKANKNSMAFSVNKSEGNSHLYHIIKDGYRVTSEPVSLEHVNRVHGGVKHLESSGHFLVPVKHHELAYDRGTSQWQLRPKK